MKADIIHDYDKEELKKQVKTSEQACKKSEGHEYVDTVYEYDKFIGTSENVHLGIVLYKEVEDNR